VWAQALLAFAVWMLYGVLQYRRAGLILAQVRRIPRRRRSFLGAFLILMSAVIMFAGIYGVARIGGFTTGGMTWWGLTLITLLGLIFVHAQTTAATYLMSLGYPDVTETPAPASRKGESTET
jgi:hypothetical protein